MLRSSLEVLTLGVTLIAMVLNPARPLFPAHALWSHWQESGLPGRRLAARAARVYDVYALRADPLRAIRADLPLGTRNVGFLATDDDSEWSLWQPLGARRVEHVSSLAAVHQEVSVIVARIDAYWPDGNAAAAAISNAGWRIVATHSIAIKASKPDERWAVLQR